MFLTSSVQNDDTYFTYLERVGVVCTTILLTIYSTSAFVEGKREEIVKKMVRLLRSIERRERRKREVNSQKPRIARLNTKGLLQ